MPNCYCIILCENSSLEEDKDTWNLSSVVEAVRINTLPASISLETHIFWRFLPDEIHHNFEGRLVISLGQGHIEYSNPFLFNSSSLYSHLCLLGMQIFAADEHRIGIEWRRQQSDNQSPWNRENVFWLFTVQLMNG